MQTSSSRDGEIRTTLSSGHIQQHLSPRRGRENEQWGLRLVRWFSSARAVDGGEVAEVKRLRETGRDK